MRLLWIRYLCVAICVLVGAGHAPVAGAQERSSEARWSALAARFEARGKPLSALVVYGALARRDPGSLSAQRGLMRIFERLGDVRRSEGLLRYALAVEPRHEAALLTAWQALDRAHPLRFSGSVALLPSSNVEHVASERFLVTDFGTFLIQDGGDETPGLGIGASLAADWVIHPRPGHRFRLRAGLAGAWFDVARLRYAEPSLSLRYAHLGGRAPWALDAYLRKRAYDGEPGDVTSDVLTRGLHFAKTWRVGRGDWVSVQARGEYQGYREKPYLSGPRYALDLDRQHPLGAQGRVSYGLHLERGLPRRDYHRYTALGARLGYERALLKGLRGGLNLGLEQRLYDAPFPVVGKHRRDQSISLGVSVALSNMRVFGQVPKLGCTARRTYSNVALYSTKTVDCALSLKLDF
ncbi:hypothetical protein DL1_06700 [Thioclava dalianensis]|uniref:Surface lipoprotein assembly modifier C-terminal domain-containing protein n=1 Tax=Thioclava dalianensis TaxID=1185766 RepID=A0A074TMN6_9RHOB|nr:hypothetical protein DL1_06700 [Thioclava dalianensis]SFM76243.1 Protein of unknown function [Thioclava dalianensis]